MSRPVKVITVFTDYICPFCYIGARRLEKLAEAVPVEVDHRFLEIHPDTPPEGMPVADLGYPEEHWKRLMQSLTRMAQQEGLHIAERSFTTNSHRALLLAEAVRAHQPAAFPALDRALFDAFFGQGRNIGDPEVLRAVASKAGVAPDTLERAFSDPTLEERLAENRLLAAQLGVHGTPAFIIDGEMLSGAVPTAMLFERVVEDEGPH